MESTSEEQHNNGIMGLTDQLLEFAPGMTGPLTEEQQTAFKKATVMLYKQLMLQHSKPTLSVSARNYHKKKLQTRYSYLSVMSSNGIGKRKIIQCSIKLDLVFTST